jgi:DNA (cytosine-5)-methyltransferase 1
MKILNLYACLGGNRYKWDEVADNLEITAVELDPELARMYQERFPNDTVIVADAHQYLLDHYKEFDFIWSSPPCPSHSRARFWGAGSGKMDTVYPDLKLYEEILFLKHYFKGKWVVENVIPYYEPLIQGIKIGRHLFWSDFYIPQFKTKDADINRGLVADYEALHEIDLTSYKGSQRKDKIGRNLVHYEAGRTILETALGIIRKNDTTQTTMFD